MVALKSYTGKYKVQVDQLSSRVYLSNPTVDIKRLQGLSDLESLVCEL